MFTSKNNINRELDRVIVNINLIGDIHRSFDHVKKNSFFMVWLLDNEEIASLLIKIKKYIHEFEE